MGSLGRVRRTVIVGLAALAVVAVAPAGAQLIRATAVHCSHGQALLALGKRAHARGVCIGVGRPQAADAWGSVPLLQDLAGALRLGSPTPDWMSRWVTGAGARSDYAHAVRTLAQLPDPAFPSIKSRARPRARPAKVTTSVGQKPFSEDGWKGTATEAASIIDPDPGAPGEAGFDTEKQVSARNGPVTMTMPEHERLLIAACPTVEGEVPGTYEWSHTRTMSVPYAGGSGTIVEHTQIEARVLGHTTDKGMLRDFDLDMTYHTYAQGIVRAADGHVIESDAPGLWTVHLVRRGLHLGSAIKEALDHAEIAGAVGPGGAWVGGIPTNHLDVARDAVRKLGLAALRSSELFQTLQGAWQDEACIDANFTSRDLSLSPHLAYNGEPNGGQVAKMKPGQLGHLSLKVTAPYGGKLAPGEYTTRLYRSGTGDDKGRLSPTAGRYSGKPLPFTYASPSKNWSKPNEEISVVVEITSHQGRALGTLDVTPTPTAHYLKTVAVSGSLDYEASYPRHQYQGDTCMITGSEKYTLGTGSQSGTGEPTDGQVVDDGESFASVPAHLTGTEDYSDPCAYPSNGDDPCHADLADDTLLGVSASHNPGAPTATVQITSFGRDFPADSYCHDRFGDDWVQNDDQHLSTQVAWSTLNGTKSFTISGSDRVADAYGRSVTRQVSITLRPVDENGRPLS